MKIRSLHIEEYKAFKGFDIDFLDLEDKPLPIVVLAGVNGSGKTTLLEYVYNPTLEDKNFIKIEIIRKFGEMDEFIEDDITEYIEEKKILFSLDLDNLDNYKQNIIYFSVGQDNIINIKETIRQKYIDRAFEIDKPSEALKELQNYIAKIFDGLDLTFNLSSINYNKNIVLFKDSNSVEFDIDDLSTGEKTLLSKVLYLYFQDYKDKVILIDEPELSLHPSWQNNVLKIYENFAKLNNCQIIIATHSPHIIGSAKSEYLRVLKKIDDKIEVFKYEKSYGLEFDKILTDIMGAKTRVSDVSKRLSDIKNMIINNDYDSQEFHKIWSELEELIGMDNIDLRLLKLEIASRKKNASNN